MMRRPALDDLDLELNVLMNNWPETISVFLRHHMLCVGCTIGPFHTVIDACREYDLDEEAFRKELRYAVSQRRGRSGIA